MIKKIKWRIMAPQNKRRLQNKIVRPKINRKRLLRLKAFTFPFILSFLLFVSYTETHNSQKTKRRIKVHKTIPEPETWSRLDFITLFKVGICTINEPSKKIAHTQDGESDTINAINPTISWLWLCLSYVI